MNIFFVIQKFMKFIKEGDPLECIDQVCCKISSLCALSSCLVFFYLLCFDLLFCGLFFHSKFSLFDDLEFLLPNYQLSSFIRSSHLQQSKTRYGWMDWGRKSMAFFSKAKAMVFTLSRNVKCFLITMLSDISTISISHSIHKSNLHIATDFTSNALYKIIASCDKGERICFCTC